MVRKSRQEKFRGLFFLGLGLLCIALRLQPGTESKVRQISAFLAALFLTGVGAFQLAWVHAPARGWKIALHLTAGLCILAFAVRIWFSPRRLQNGLLCAFWLAIYGFNWLRGNKHSQEDS